MTRKEAHEAAVVKALGRKPLTVSEIVGRTGLSHAAVSQAIYRLRSGDECYITVAEHSSGYTYRIAENVWQTIPGTVNQAKHMATRAESQIALASHQRRLAVDARDVAVSDLIEKSGVAAKAQAEMVLAALSVYSAV